MRYLKTFVFISFILTSLYSGQYDFETIYQRPYRPNPGRDNQCCGPTPIRLWAIDGANFKGVFISYFRFGTLMWKFYDFNTQTWYPLGDTFAYPPSDTAGYGGLFLNLSPLAQNTYEYPFFNGHTYETGNYEDCVWYPKPPFDPVNFDTNYISIKGEGAGLWPMMGLTGDSMFVHQISTDYFNTGGIFYNRLRKIEDTMNASWDGKILLISDDVGPWYAFYTDPLGKKVVIAYYDISSGGLVFMIDSLQGSMFYNDSYLVYNITDTLIKYGYEFCYAFVNLSTPFIDRDHRIHYIFNANNGVNSSPIVIYHFYEKRNPPFVIIDTVGSDSVPYSMGVNATAAGRGQVGQNYSNGHVYAIWEEFVTEPGNFVVSSTGDTLAPTRIVLWMSDDVDEEYVRWECVDTLLESGLRSTFPGHENHWYRFPILSPFVLSRGDTDLIIWGCYDDYDPGFLVFGQGDYSEVDLIVGFTKVWSTGVSERPKVKTEFLNLSAYLRYMKNGEAEIVVFSPFKTETGLRIFDNDGRLVKEFSMDIKRGYNIIPLENLELKKGIYFIEISQPKNKKLIRKFVNIK